MWSKGKEDMKKSYEAAKSVDVKNGWEGFKETITVSETKYSLIKAPVGVAYCLTASFLYILFCLVFVSSKYGPSAFQNASLVIKQKSEQLNENVITPLKQNLRPMIIDAKAKVEQAIKDRTQTKSGEEGGSDAVIAEVEDLESKLPEEEET